MSEFKKGDRVRHIDAEPSAVGTVGIVAGRWADVDWDNGERGSYTHTELQPAPEPLLAQLDRVSERVRNEDAETRTTSSTGAEKGVKAEAFSLLPVEALEKVARHYRVGAEKYSAHNWRAGYE